VKRWMSQAVAAWAVLAVLADQLLSVTWGFMVLVLAFAWLAQQLNSATGVKAADAHARINALVPVVHTANTTANNALPKAGGTVTGSLAVNGNHSVGGQVLINGASSAAALAAVGDGHVTGTFQADNSVVSNQVVAAGVSTSASVGGTTAHFTGTMQADGGVAISGGTISSITAHTSNPIVVSGGSPSGFSGSQLTAVASISNVLNDLVNRMQASGMMA
jgi:hypothetical protein